MAIAMLILLSAQYLTGLYMNLYVQLPRGHGDSHPVSMGIFMAGGGLLMLHVALGVATLAGALVVTMVSSTIGKRALFWSSAGTGTLVLAAASGMGFLMSNQSNVASLLMAIGWLLAAAAYTGQLVDSTSGRHRTPSSDQGW